MSRATVLETGVIYCDDNLARLTDLPDASVDLVYLDPPFFSNRTYEVIWGDEAEVRSFEDRWRGGVGVYIEWMRDRVLQLHRVLKPTGSLYLHCDPHASHYLKVMLDSIFGSERFLNEIIWKRTSAHSSARRFGPVHDVILLYAKTSTYTWNQQYQPYDDAYIKQRFARDDGGRPWKDADLTGSGTRNGETGTTWRGFNPTDKGRHWAYPPAELDRLDASGFIYWPRKEGAWPRLKKYLDEAHGIPAADIWTDIVPINSQARERLGYPTQKPEELLERIVKASSNRGDIVLDPFAGCGTTLAAAQLHARRWIGIDISPTAAEITRRRMLKLGADEVIVHNLPTTVDALRELKPFEFQNWVVHRVNGTHAPRRSGDMGVDGYSFLEHLPIQVKQSEKVGRNVVDNFETAITREGKHKGYIVAFSFTRNAHEEVSRARREHGLEIVLVTVANLLESPGLATAPRPEAEQLVHDVFPQPRPASARPTVQELVESDTAPSRSR